MPIGSKFKVASVLNLYVKQFKVKIVGRFQVFKFFFKKNFEAEIFVDYTFEMIFYKFYLREYKYVSMNSHLPIICIIPIQIVVVFM